MAQTIEEHWVKVEALGSLGTILAEEQQWEQAHATWAEAEVEAHMVTEDDGKADAFHELALIYIEAKQWERTAALLLKTEESREKDESRLEFSRALAEEQQWQYAEEVVRAIESEEITADALSQLAEMLTSAQRQEQAKALLVEAQVMIQAIEECQEEQASLFSYTKARVLLRSQRWAEVLTLTQTLDDDNERIWILRDLGNAIIKAHQWDQIDDVIHMIDQSEKYGERVDALYVLSSAFAEGQQWERAQSILHLIEESQGKARALLDLGIALAGAQQLQKAQAVWAEVLALVPIWEDYSERAEILLDIGMMLAKTSQLEQAQMHWKEAERMASLIEDDQEKSHILCRIGASLNVAQQREHAEAVWSQAEAAAHAIEREEERDQALWLLSITLAYAHRWERAETVAHSITENKERAQALHTLIAVLSYVQQEEKAEAIAVEWLNLVSSLGKDDMIYTIGQEFIRAHLWERAVAMINLMEESSWQRVHLQGKLVEELAREQQWEHAEAIVANMKEGKERAEALSMLGMMLALSQEQAQAEAKWVEAEIVTSGLRDSWEKDSALNHILHNMGLALAQTHQWERAEIVANRMAENRDRADILREIQESLEASTEHERSLHLLQRSWRQASRKDYLFKLFPLTHVFITDNPEIAYAFFDSFAWVDSILKEVR